MRLPLTAFCLQIRITELVSSTYYSRIHLSKAGGVEVDVDSRPSDAINLAVRFGAPMYIHRRIAASATPYPTETFSAHHESHADILRSVKETLAHFEVRQCKLVWGACSGPPLGMGGCFSAIPTHARMTDCCPANPPATPLFRAHRRTRRPCCSCTKISRSKKSVIPTHR